MQRPFVPPMLLLLLIMTPALLGPTTSRAQGALPTPEGQLGGPLSLATVPPLAVATSEPTSTPTEPATPEENASPAATPGPAGTTERDVPSAEECKAAPVDLRLLLDRLATTPGFIETALASPPVAPSTPTPYALPEGEPADDATGAGVSATVREYVACLNAQAPAQQLALFTDAYLGRQLTGSLGQPYPDLVATAAAVIATEAAIAATPGTPEETAILEIRDVRILADGRAAATVVLDPPEPLSTAAFALVLVQVGNRWLIDDLVALPENGVS